MREEFLHYIWKYQYFSKEGLCTTDGVLEIFKQGYHNTNAGPDFKEAHIQIEKLEWRGSVEIHVRSSEWMQHHHQNDKAYNNTILHVVWDDDKEALRADGTTLPTLVLKGRVDQQLILQYNQLMNSTDVIPCARQVKSVDDITKLSMLEKVLVERLEEKSRFVNLVLQHTNNDWEETTYQVMAKNFGFKINAEVFFVLAQSIPFKVVKKHLDKPIQVEALFFGQAGFLDDHAHDYVFKLKKEYDFLRKKYQLKRRLDKHQWKWLRLRPANFPPIRLAQFVSFLQSNYHLFSLIQDFNSFKTFNECIKKELPLYWQEHYDFGKKSASSHKSIGQQSIQNVAINSIAPLMAAYAHATDDMQYIRRVEKLLQDLKPERNRITGKMEAVGFENKTAYDSQSLLQLHNAYCQKKRCLQCNVGNKLMNR